MEDKDLNKQEQYLNFTRSEDFKRALRGEEESIAFKNNPNKWWLNKTEFDIIINILHGKKY